MLQYIHRQLHNIKWTSCSDVLKFKKYFKKYTFGHAWPIPLASALLSSLSRPWILWLSVKNWRRVDALEDWFSSYATPGGGKIRRSWRSQAVFFFCGASPTTQYHSIITRTVETVHNVQNLRKRPCVPPMHSDLLAIPPGRSFIMERCLRHLKDPFDIAWWCMIGNARIENTFTGTTARWIAKESETQPHKELGRPTSNCIGFGLTSAPKGTNMLLVYLGLPLKRIPTFY